jgi:hypothetical protein
VELTQLIQASDRLHERVQRFAAGQASDTFEGLALALAEHQARGSPGYARLLRARGGRLSCVNDIPPVPSEAFRLTRVAVHPPELDQARFLTSGTSGAERGLHAMRRTDTYEQLSLRWGRHALLPADAAPGSGSAVVIALAPAPADPPSSSLGYMMEKFMSAFDDQPLATRWLLSGTGVDVSGLERAIELATRRQRRLLVLTTAFALVKLLDERGDRPLALPKGSVVMQTGGFKGRTRELSGDELRAQASACFQLDESRVVGEYGMTELTSQLYEPSIGESGLARDVAVSERLYFAPSWLRVTPVNPLSLEPVPDGEIGLARFVDLGNVDSAVSVVTQDCIRCVRGGIQLLGRQPGAPPRGCSLAIEALLDG